MATLNINGQKVKVDDSFMALSPQQQSAAVDEIAAKLPRAAPAGPAVAPQGLVPGSRKYADWAAQAARSGRTLPQVSPPPPVQQQPGPNLADATLATINGITGSVPFLQEGSDALLAGGQAGLDAITGKPVDFGANYNAIRDRRRQIAEKAPISNILGGVGGTIAGAGALGSTKLGAEALGMSGSWLKQLINSSASTAGYEGLQGLAHGHTGGELLKDEGIGGLSGALGSGFGQGIKKAGEGLSNTVTDIAQSRLVKPAIANAPDAEGLKDVSRQLFKQVDDSGVKVSTDKFSGLVQNLAEAAKKDHIDETLDPKAFGVYRQLVSILGDAQSGARPLTISDMHTIRQIAQRAAISTDGRDAMFANRVVDGIDGFINQPGALSAGGQQASKDLSTAIKTWGRAKRVSLIDEAIYKAQNQASGVENGLRTQFRALLQDPKKRALFSELERKQIQKVVNGTGLSNLTRLLGMFGFDFGSGRNMVGGSIGALTGGVPLVIAGSLARKGAEKLAINGANRVAKIVATPNIPVARQAPNLLAPANVPLQVLIRGGIPAIAGNR